MDEPILGMIELFPFGFAPYGWMLCNGAIMQISSNQALYSIIGNTYGGDATKGTFALPNLTGTEPLAVIQMKFYIAITGMYPVRQ
jgi:microcystin-dependent protein